MSEHTQFPWKWHSRIEDGLQTGSIFSEKVKGHAYAVAIAPRYQTEEQWKVDAEFIIKAAENYEALVKALQLFISAMNNNGNWDDGCFYYNGRSATELQRPIDFARETLAKVKP